MIIGIAGNTTKANVKKVISDFVDYLRSIGVGYVIASELDSYLGLESGQSAVPLQKIGNHCQVVVAFGGDGTLLYTASKIGESGVPILGVNTGVLGFLTEVVVDELRSSVQSLLDGAYAIVQRMILEVAVERPTEGFTYHALNDVVVDKGKGARLITVEVSVDDVFLNRIRSDGVIIATPTGSTAYSLSAGGPLLEPTMKAVIVTPICPHSLTVRPIVLSGDRELKICLLSADSMAQINIDGQFQFNLSREDVVRIKQADYLLNWISLGKRDFYEILRTKLNWGADWVNFPETGSGR
jgi:NAD+ kinase